MLWIQRTLEVPPVCRGLHLITHRIVGALPELGSLSIGLLNVFLQHTSASLTINENADPDVRRDLEASLSHLVPERFPYSHTIEGPDDMPAHVKAALLGASLTIPVSRGALALGTWQGITLAEHRDRGGPRRLVLTLWGQPSGESPRDDT
ncbi:MAG: secondary thiamine-phosphate synthase enzyme YjbQ [Lacipirellulaceae bacterium]